MPEPFVLSLILAMFLVVALLSTLARRLRASSAVVMLVAGVLLALAPGVPAITLDPDLVLLALLPPLLYGSGVGMSWRGFRSNLRPILSLAIGCVLFTASAVAAVAHYLLGLSWAAGFVLGAIVSPPDSVAPQSLRHRFKLPRRLLTILEGESLANDATALVTFALAVRAVETGQFSPTQALLQFVAIVAGEIAFGCALGFLVLRLRNAVADPRAEILIALATPYLAFWPPHEAGGSGVIACLAVGLYVSWNGRNYIRPATRLQGFFIWDLGVLVRRGDDLPDLRPADAGDHRPPLERGLGRADPGGAGGQRDRHRGALPVGVPGHLPAALAVAAVAQAREGAELAAAVPDRLRRLARRRQPRRGVVDPVDGRRRAVSASRPDPVRHHLRDRRDVGGARGGAGAADALARSRPRRRARSGGQRARGGGGARRCARTRARPARRAGDRRRTGSDRPPPR